MKILVLALFFHLVYTKNEPKTWVLLAAGSNGWWNYRHQADICHAYQIVRKHGIPDENIIVMMYDDIAYNSQNPKAGVIINHPKGPNVYDKVPKDYTGDDVTPKNFINILLGNETAMKGIGSGKVIKSTKNDRIFVNFVDHGASGILCFPGDDPNDSLTAGELIKALKQMHAENRYAEMVMYIEACESGSMFRGILPKDMNIFVTTAADYNESSYACYCHNIDTCLGDTYSVSWMEDTDKEDINRELLYDQYLIVKKEVNMSSVQEYGTLKIAKLPVGEFQGEESGPSVTYPEVPRDQILSYDVPLAMLQMKRKKTKNSTESKMLQAQYISIIMNRQMLTKMIKSIVRLASNTTQQAADWLDHAPEEIKDLNCHTELVHKFSRECFSFRKHPYALKYGYVLTNMCNDGIDVESLTPIFIKYCKRNMLTGNVI